MMESGVKHTQLERICIQALKAQEDRSPSYQTEDLEQQKEQPVSSCDICLQHQNEVILRIECITERQMKVGWGVFLKSTNAQRQDSHPGHTTICLIGILYTSSRQGVRINHQQAAVG